MMVDIGRLFDCLQYFSRLHSWFVAVVLFQSDVFQCVFGICFAVVCRTWMHTANSSECRLNDSFLIRLNLNDHKHKK